MRLAVKHNELVERWTRGDVTDLVDVLVYRRIAERVQLLLRLAHERVQPRLHIRQLVPDMVHEHLVERLRQILRAVLVRDVAVRGVRAEELGLGGAGGTWCDPCDSLVVVGLACAEVAVAQRVLGRCAALEYV